MTRMLKAGAASTSTCLGDLALVMAPMMLTVVPQARAQPRPTENTVIQTAITEGRAGPDDRFRLRVHDEMAEWRRKMRTFGETMETRTRRNANATEVRLRTAWDDTEVEARKVQTVTARDWDRTKRAYEATLHRMAMAWDKARL